MLFRSMPFTGTIFFIAGLCSLGLPGFSGFVAEMTVFVGSWERAELFYRIATILACASIVVTAVYILRALGSSIMGPLNNDLHVDGKFGIDAAWNERLATLILIAGIVIIGVAPFMINELITPGTIEIMKHLSQLTLSNIVALG